MRREWSDWIKTRQWGQFEKLAKSEPSQHLTDTVAELELGIPEKRERRSLRKILYLLAQAGFEPTEVENAASESTHPASRLSIAFMVSPESAGESVLTYGREDKGRVAWLIAHLSPREGITQALEDTTTLDETQARIRRLRGLQPSPSLSAEVPVDFALNRLAVAAESTKVLPPILAYWRALLPREPDRTHPAESLPRASSTPDQLRDFLVKFKPLRFWRLELGSVVPALEAFIEAHGDKATSEETGDSEWWGNTLTADRAKLFTDDLIEDHRSRLLDLAYVVHLKQGHESATLLALADDLRVNGPESAYAKLITTKSLIFLFEILKRSAESRSDRPSGE